MNNDSNQVYLSKQETREILLSISDLTAYFIYRWKWLLGLVIAGVLFGGLLWFKASTEVKTTTNESLTEKVNSLKEGLSAEQVDQVDYLYAQYVSYKGYRLAMQDYMSSSLYDTEDYAGNIRNRTLYYVESDISNAAACLYRLTLGKSEYEKIAVALGKDRLSLDDIYRRVSIYNLSSLDDPEGTSFIVSGGDEKEQNKCILEVDVVSETEEQAEAVIGIVERAFNRELERLRKIDSTLKFTKIGSQYSADISDFLANRQTTVMNNLNSANNAIIALQLNYVDKLAADERAYYDALKARGDLELAPAKVPSKLKYLIIGVFIGIILFLGWFTLTYLFDGTEKTLDDLKYGYGMFVPYTICRKKKGLGLFNGLARKITNKDLSDIAVRPALVESDIAIRLEKQGYENAFLVMDASTDWQKEMAEELKKNLGSNEKSVQVTCGNPLSSVEELQEFAKTQAVLLLVEMKKTKRNSVQKWVELCSRYGLPVEGVIALEEC